MARASDVVVITWPNWERWAPCIRRRLEREGLEVRSVPSGAARSVREMGELLSDARAAIVSTDNLDETVFERCERLRVVARVGTGLDAIDVASATRHGVVIITTPDIHEDTVADHTVALMLAVVRQIVANDASVRSGAWDRGGSRTGGELHESTVGLLGFGEIGKRVAKRLRGFDVELLACDPRMTGPSAGAEPVGFDELLSRASILSVHVPLTEATRHMLGSREFAMMRPEAILVNTARGGVIDEAALERALVDGRIAGAGLDVFAFEPPQNSNLLQLPNVVLSPHVAGVSRISLQSMLIEAAAGVVDALKADSPPRNAVNPQAFRSRRT